MASCKQYVDVAENFLVVRYLVFNHSSVLYNSFVPDLRRVDLCVNQVSVQIV